MGSNTISTPVSSEAALTGTIDASCRLPFFVMSLGAAAWLLLGSVFALIASIKFHSPNFLADAAWFTYGRVWPAFTNCLLYGFCMQAGLGVGLWLLARLGRAPLVGPSGVVVGALFWNLGVALGVGGILRGDSTGFSFLEMPAYSAAPLFLGYAIPAISGVLTFRQRREGQTFVSQWFLLAAIFWFPWIYSTAQLLLVLFPVRGMAQAVIAWWYAENLSVVWLGLVGLAAAFYFLAKLAGRDLHSHYLAVFIFWMLVIFGSWGGVPATAPVPAWLPAVSGAASVMNFMTVLVVFLIIRGTLKGRYGALLLTPWAPFIAVSLGVFLVSTVAKSLGGLADATHLLDFTWYTPATQQLYWIGFAGMVLFGAVYAILPQVAGRPLCSPRLARFHFWLTLAAAALIFVPLAACGVKEAAALRNREIAFLDISKGTLPFLRAGTIGCLLLALGSLVFLLNIVSLVVELYRARAMAALAAATAPIPAEGVKA